MLALAAVRDEVGAVSRRLKEMKEDMFFATLSAAVALIIPLVVRYVTYNLVYREPAEILHQAAYIAIGLFLSLIHILLVITMGMVGRFLMISQKIVFGSAE